LLPLVQWWSSPGGLLVGGGIGVFVMVAAVLTVVIVDGFARGWH
jgi:hypothetical protein